MLSLFKNNYSSDPNLSQYFKFTDEEISKYEQDLINNFDIYQYLVDDEYRKKASNYYDIIKSTVNVYEMME